jgi:glutaredoxin
MKIFGRWLLAILIIAAVLGAGWYWWKTDLKWRPKTITKNQAEITKVLESSGWVSPGLAGPKLYILSFRSCPDCIAFKRTYFARLHAAQVDTRVIEIARKDYKGVPKSTPVERATVAELWVNRSWALAENWDNTPIDAWKAEGIAPADGDVARTAVIEAGRKTVEDLSTLLKPNGVTLAYPTLIWWNKDGQMRTLAWDEGVKYDRAIKELAPE